MLDLTKKSLPNTVRVGGSDFSVYTDFRLWMRFEIEVSKLQRGEQMDVSYLFKNKMPLYCRIHDLFSFSRPEYPLPRDMSHKDVIALDYELDGDLIYSAFLDQYGIDLLEIATHLFFCIKERIKNSLNERLVIGASRM